MEYIIDDYIVCLKAPLSNPDASSYEGEGEFKSNHYFKVREVKNFASCIVIFPYNDSKFGIFSNSLRKATQQEIDYYNQINKPYDITTVNFDLTINNFEIW